MDPENLTASSVSRGRFSKKWPQLFSESRKPQDTGPFIDALRQVGAVNDGIELFMQQYNDNTANVRFETVTRIFNNVTIGDFNNQHLSKRGTAWLDDHPTALSILELKAHGLPDDTLRHKASIETLRQMDEGNSQVLLEETKCDIVDARNTIPATLIPRAGLQPRKYPDHLTARDLHHHLREKRFDHEYLEDAARRLIYIADPDGCDILALTETAREDRKRALYDTLWQFCAHQTSLKVKISPLTGGYAVFQLELHIPVFVVQRTPWEDLQSDTWKKTHPNWVNLSFLDDYGQGGVLGMHESQFSLTICGSDNLRWDALCLEETRFDEDREVGDDERGPLWRADQISMGKLDAELPLRDPREYYLAIWRIRLRYAVEEMEGLVVRAETAYSRKTSASASAPVTSEWIEDMLKLADRSIPNISKLTDQWKLFQAISGDIGYFEDTTVMAPSALGARMQDALAALNEMFVELECFEKRFRSIQEQCFGLRNNLDHRLTRRSSQIGQITFIMISPIFTVAGIFAIPTKVVPFKINTLSFSLSVAVCTLLYMSLGLIGGWLEWQVLLQTLKESVQRLKEFLKWLKSLTPRIRRRMLTRNGTNA